MAANLFFLPYRPIFDGNAAIVPGGKVWFTLAGSNTAAGVYSNEALTTPRANPVVADGVGKLPTGIYLNAAVSYRVRIYAKTATVGVDTPLQEFNPYVPGVFADAATLQPVADAAANSATAAANSAGSAGTAAGAAATSATAAAALAEAAASAAAEAEESADAAQQAAEIAQAIIADADLDVSGATIAAINRTVMANAATSLPIFLSEAGREGVFIWDSGNLSAAVAADTAQGVYVAPASDATGASGAWKRVVPGYHNVKWFGAKGDNATDDTNAIKAARDYLKYVKAALGTTGCPTLLFPAGYYRITSAIDWYNQIHLLGEGSRQAAVSVINSTADIKHFRFQSHNTDGDSGTVASGSLGNGAASSIVEGLWFDGGYVAGTAETTTDGIYARCRVTVKECGGDNFGRAVVAILAGTDGNPVLGNANEWSVEGLTGQSNARMALYVGGTDTNAGQSRDVSGDACRQAVIVDDSFLGNAHYSGKVGNPVGFGGDGVTIPAALVHYGGHRYSVVRGQEAWASTNAPTGAATDNQGWYYINDFGAVTGCPTWFNGISLRAGGGFITAYGGNNRSEFYSCYNEDGTPFSQIAAPGTVFGGTLINGGVKGTTYIRTTSEGATVLTRLYIGETDVPQILSGQVNWGSANVFPIHYYDSSTGLQLAFRSFTGGFQRDGALTIVRSYGGPKLTGLTRVGFAIGDYFGGDIETWAITASGAGYATGVGGAVTQATSKATGVTLNKVCGQITTNAASLAANTGVSFTFTNSAIAATDTLIVNIASGATANSYIVAVDAVTAGSCRIHLRNVTGGALAQALVLNFAVIKGAAA